MFTSSPFRGDRFQHEMVGVSLKLDEAGTPLRPGMQTPFNRIQSNVQTRVTWCSCGSSGCWGTGRPQSWTTWWFPRARSGAGCSRPEPSLTTRRNSRSEPNQGVTTSTGKCSVLQPAWSKDQTCKEHFWWRRWWWSQHAGTQPADQKFTEKPEKKSEQKRLSWLRKILMFWKEWNANVFVEVDIEVLVWVDPTEPVEPGRPGRATARSWWGPRWWQWGGPRWQRR